mgnify:CR=1 FL=1
MITVHRIILDCGLKYMSFFLRFVMWQVENGHPPLVPQESRLFSPKLKPPPFPTKIIRLEFRHDNLDYYTELDAIELMGYGPMTSPILILLQ